MAPARFQGGHLEYNVQPTSTDIIKCSPQARYHLIFQAEYPPSMHVTKNLQNKFIKYHSIPLLQFQISDRNLLGCSEKKLFRFVSVLRWRHSSCTALLASAEELEVSFTLSMQFCSSKGIKRTEQTLMQFWKFSLSSFISAKYIFAYAIDHVKHKMYGPFCVDWCVSMMNWLPFSDNNISGVAP